MQQQLLIFKPSEIFRETKLEQTHIGFSKDGKFCAFGVLMNKFGWNGDNDNFAECYNKAQELLGRINPGYIAALNTSYTFSEIADMLEKEGL